MTTATAHVLKSDQVTIEGSFQLSQAMPGYDPHNNPGGSVPGTVQPHNTTPAQAVIVENHPQYAIIELTCRCGQKTYLKCQYEQ